MSSRQGLRLLAAAGLLGLAVLSAPGTSAARSPGSEVLLEGGFAGPLGDLGDDYFTTVKGLGAETGYEVGLRFRYFLTREWALAPAFHYVEFGDFNGIDPGLGTLQVETSVLRYGVDLQYFFPGRRQQLRPFLSGGLGLCRNRYEDFLQEDQSFFETSINALGLSLGGGLRVGDFEFSAIYTLNRFETRRFSSGLEKQEFDWDWFVVRAGFAFPTE
jgi:hypothetical protein